MGDFLRIVLDSIAYLWPFKVIYPWQRGLYYVAGRYWRDFGAGLYFAPPFVTKLVIESVVPETTDCTTETVTVASGGTITYGVQLELSITDLPLAVNTVGEARSKARQDSKAVVADVLFNSHRYQDQAQMEAVCVAEINAYIQYYGMHCHRVSFPTYVVNMRNYRLFTGE